MREAEHQALTDDALGLGLNGRRGKAHLLGLNGIQAFRNPFSKFLKIARRLCQIPYDVSMLDVEWELSAF